MKPAYIPPLLEVYAYSPERGYAASVAADVDYRDYVLIEGNDYSLRTAEEITEYTEYNSETGSTEYTIGLWD